MLKINTLEDEFDSDINQFLDGLSKSDNCVLGYHYPFYRDMLRKIAIGEPYYIGLYEEDHLVALLPGFIKSTELGKVYSSLPFFGPNAGVLCQSERRIECTKQIMKFLLEEVDKEDFISSSWYSSFLSDSELEDELLTGEFPITIEKFTSYVEMENFNLSSKIRYDIRKSEKAGVTIANKIDSNKIDELYNIYIENCNDFDIPIKPKKCIELLAEEAVNGDHVSVTFAEIDGKVIGGLIMIWSKSVASYYLPCALNEYRTLQPNTLLINHAFSEASERNIRIWNWESSPSKESGVYQFKKKWGSVDRAYKVFIRPNKEKIFYQNLGSKKISDHFPNYFVYPFDYIDA